ncbi:MAG: HNH endonuclease [Proteobacteria bacterium]|nr:MAG: HNH endonuclease [Pseudomonadota bacterium]
MPGKCDLKNSLPAENLTPDLSEDLIARIRALPPERFEATFMEQLRRERRISIIVIYFMKEAYRRREWARNYPNFTKYCVERLKMSEADFYRKYSVLRTIEEIPEMEQKLLTGEIAPATVAKVSQFFHRESKIKSEPLTIEQKRDVFAKMEGLSHRQVERELAIRSPQSALPDKTRQITETAFVRQFTTNQDLENKITRAKQLLMHTLPQPPSDCQLFTKITDLALEKIDPILKQKRMDQRAQREADRAGDLNQKGKVSAASARAETQKQQANLTDESNVSVSSGNSTGAKSTASPSRTRTHIPEALKREVLQRDDYACSHVNYDTGKICGSKDAIELDHILPVAQGGENTLENLRVLCRTHNQLRALETYGRKKMGEHISSM